MSEETVTHNGDSRALLSKLILGHISAVGSLGTLPQCIPWLLLGNVFQVPKDRFANRLLEHSPIHCWELPFFDLFIQERCSGLSPSNCLAGGDLALASRGWGQPVGRADSYCSVLTGQQATPRQGRRAEHSEAVVQLVSDKGLHLRSMSLPFLPHVHLVEERKTMCTHVA